MQTVQARLIPLPFALASARNAAVSAGEFPCYEAKRVPGKGTPTIGSYPAVVLDRVHQHLPQLLFCVAIDVFR
jgi:hypothetical protein